MSGTFSVTMVQLIPTVDVFTYINKPPTHCLPGMTAMDGGNAKK
ncbi:hypothetical protein [Pelagibaculum spongiae]|nr:hypothetical protein [Pelagibaculum spongiae]